MVGVEQCLLGAQGLPHSKVHWRDPGASHAPHGRAEDGHTARLLALSGRVRWTKSVEYRCLCPGLWPLDVGPMSLPPGGKECQSGRGRPRASKLIVGQGVSAASTPWPSNASAYGGQEPSPPCPHGKAGSSVTLTCLRFSGSCHHARISQGVGMAQTAWSWLPGPTAGAGQGLPHCPWTPTTSQLALWEGVSLPECGRAGTQLPSAGLCPSTLLSHPTRLLGFQNLPFQRHSTEGHRVPLVATTPLSVHTWHKAGSMWPLLQQASQTRPAHSGVCRSSRPEPPPRPSACGPCPGFRLLWLTAPRLPTK